MGRLPQIRIRELKNEWVDVDRYYVILMMEKRKVKVWFILLSNSRRPLTNKVG